MLKKKKNFSRQDEISEVFEEIRNEVDVKFEKFRKWTPKYKDNFRECFFGDGIDAINEISKATRCVMKVDWVTREVNIGAHSDIALEAGLEKLNLAEKYFVSISQVRGTTDKEATDISDLYIRLELGLQEILISHYEQRWKGLF